MSSPANSASRVWRWLEKLSLTAAVIGLGFWGVTTAVPQLWQRWANRDFERNISRRSESQNNLSQSDNDEAPKTRDVIGRLTIPRLQLSVIVREGADSTTLGLSAGHIPGTALPGRSGNIAIAAHRDTLFRALAKVARDDVIRLDDRNGGQYYYQVGSTEVVPPTDMSVLKGHSSSELTLVTCFPFDYIGSAPDRFIVRAHAISAISATAHHAGPSVETSLSVAMVKPEPSPTLKPYRVAPIPYRNVAEGKIYFTVEKHHSRKVAEGVSFGVTDIDPENQEVEGWLWLMPERRTVWLRSQSVGDALELSDDEGGKRREVVITKVTSSSVAGYLLN